MAAVVSSSTSANRILAIDSSRQLDAIERTDSPVEENALDDVASFDTATSSAASSSFQGTETDSLQDALSAAATFGTTLERRKLQGVEKAIDRLYRLSLIIRQPSRESQNERAGRVILKDEDGNDIDQSFARFAGNVVDHKFPKAPAFLREKLAYGIVIRRKRFWYRQSHQRKLVGSTTHLNTGGNVRNVDGDGTEKLDSTVRNLRVTEPTTAGDALPTRVRDKHEATPSRTSASAIPEEPLPLKNALEESQSHQSTVFTIVNSASAAVEIPRPPKPVCGSKELECPYCCLVLPIKLTKAARWR